MYSRPSTQLHFFQNFEYCKFLYLHFDLWTFTYLYLFLCLLTCGFFGTKLWLSFEDPVQELCMCIIEVLGQWESFFHLFCGVYHFIPQLCESCLHWVNFLLHNFDIIAYKKKIYVELACMYRLHVHVNGYRKEQVSHICLLRKSH